MILLASAPKVSLVELDLPAQHVLLLTLNRPKALNAVSPDLAHDVQRALAWFDNEPSLWVAIITGAGRTFCAGMDLKVWLDRREKWDLTEAEGIAATPDGFAYLSRRSVSAKPIIAAVNGGAYGGGMEIVLNSDIVIASEQAVFALPEVKRGVIAAAGGIPRLAAIAGHQLASEMLLTGRAIKAQEAYARFGFVNAVVPPAAVIPTALEWAHMITENSPDAVTATKRSLILAQQLGNFEHATIATGFSPEGRRVYGGENIKEGLRAFSEKRKPVWKNPAKL